jgi:hypothetical protein
MAVALSGCTVSAREPTGYVEVTSAPYDVDAYPSTYYEGRQVYLVNNQWMFRDGGRWARYRNEPPALYRQRGVIIRNGPTYNRRAPGIQQAPPAYRNGPGIQQAPPAYRGAPPAPPAVRVQ